MLLKTICMLLFIGLFSFGCGGSTPQPESADSETDGPGETGTDVDSGEGGVGESATDPETTEEVIETSEPLD